MRGFVLAQRQPEWAMLKTSTVIKIYIPCEPFRTYPLSSLIAASNYPCSQLAIFRLPALHESV